eukprot:gnl/MRDRNA2_/MRDRNA2_183937_c0_seq1.p1 gnl/MRDRNA2_/MRDRNA2_183937_c0~~gnl/MRDRNA2_/MRDRNA2_183937_c0_seq1.p1  ORF type:complete len:458 (+),score=121.20 gnl/MRDRNA2_/MRDRNA2_183937_c0_seq1:86-1375(+)
MAPVVGAPPGLGPEPDAETVPASTTSKPQYSPIVEDIRKSMLEDVEKKIDQKASLFPAHQYDELRRAVLQEVDARMAEKVDALWKKGQQTVKAFQQKQSAKTQALLEELSACRVKQESMEEEHTKLKVIYQQLAQRFHQLQLETMAQNPEEAAAVATAMAAVMQADTDNADPRTPPQDRADFLASYTSGMEVDGTSAPMSASLRDVPPFPFPPHTSDTGYPVASPVATLKLADALESEAAPKAPLSLASTLPGLKSPTPSQPKSTGSPNSDGSVKDKNNITFSFTLRKADGASLGLDVSHNNSTKDLHVCNVLPGGAVDAWNRQCANGQPERAVLKGDRIVSVNSVSGCGKSMLEECKNNQLLKLTLVRGKGTEEDEELQKTPKSSVLNPAVPAFEPPTKSSGASSASEASSSKNVSFSFNAEAKAFVP